MSFKLRIILHTISASINAVTVCLKSWKIVKVPNSLGKDYIILYEERNVKCFYQNGLQNILKPF